MLITFAIFVYKELCLYLVSNLHTFPNLSNADSRINFCNVKQQHIQDSHKYLKWSSFYQNLNGWTKKLHHWCLWEFWIANWNLYRKWNIFDCFKWAKYRCFDPLSLNFKFGNYWTHWILSPYDYFLSLSR